MKTLVLALALLLPAAAPIDPHATAPGLGNPMIELAALTDCTASQLALMQMHQQTVALIRATMPSSSSPQLTKLLDSYTVLAKDAHEQVDSYMATINDVVIPQIAETGGDTSNIGQQFMAVLYHKIIHNAVALNDPTRNVEDQTAVVRGIIEQTAQCASLAAAVRQEYKGSK
jgi:hypothetical protein